MKNKIKHVGNCFILGRQGRDIAKISEPQLLECMEILKKELTEQLPVGWPKTRPASWEDVIEYLQDRKEKR